MTHDAVGETAGMARPYGEGTVTETQEKRRHPRIKHQLVLQSSSPEQGLLQMSTTDLSLGGVLARTDHFLPLMTRVALTLQLRPQVGPSLAPRMVRAEAVVVRIDPAVPAAGPCTYEMALFFSRMAEPDRNTLADYLSTQPA